MFNLFHIKYFLDAARLGSVAAAAKENHVSSPGVSQAIRRLEEQLGDTLLTHRKNHFELTAMGRSSSTLSWMFSGFL